MQRDAAGFRPKLQYVWAALDQCKRYPRWPRTYQSSQRPWPVMIEEMAELED
jgi:hypothetical protein